ncbi:hypothetical protein F511_29760 [Dorcoceras hygrometricum]|uniref:Uncharacterized protein n=1 Tax=Dorcoceras hygrometricum TaxID=472368 RepID=A0A2Z7C7L0_9LAMI|nr:hypothetical protein F511_29760 [Dorcoceras hygrometricum]
MDDPDAREKRRRTGRLISSKLQCNQSRALEDSDRKTMSFGLIDTTAFCLRAKNQSMDLCDSGKPADSYSDLGSASIFKREELVSNEKKFEQRLIYEKYAIEEVFVDDGLMMLVAQCTSRGKKYREMKQSTTIREERITSVDC